jgi:predicted ATPase
VEEAFTQALELCQRAGEIPQLFSVLRGLASFYILQGNFEKGTQLGEQILSLADRYNDANMRVEAYLVLGGSAQNMIRGLDYLEKGILNFDPDRQPPRRFRLGPNPGVTCYSVSALYLWMLGFPDRALERSNEAVILAKRLDHPYSLAYALFHKGMLHLWRREASAAQKCAQAVLDIAGVHTFKIWSVSGTCLNGAALAGMGQIESGLALLRLGMNSYQEMKNPPVFWLILLSMRARVHGLAGKPEEGLVWLNPAMQMVGQNTDNFFFGDFCILNGDLLLAISPDRLAEAESLFQQALEAALKLQATMLELQAAIRLCRIWMVRGKAKQGRRLLSDAYEKFTEGFATAELMEAKELLFGHEMV